MPDFQTTEQDLHVTEDDLLEARELASKYTLEDVRHIMARVYRIHEKDPNFPLVVIQKIKAFLENDELFTNPEKHESLVQEMKLESDCG